jgi:hypothetical protein
LYSILLQHTNSPRVGLDSHFSGESVSFRDYTLPVKIDMSAPELTKWLIRAIATGGWRGGGGGGGGGAAALPQ